MNIYRLDDKAMDEAFLGGNEVLCDAVVPCKDLDKDLLREGDRIVIALSNGKKYMGKVSGFTYEIRDSVAFGKLKLVRYPS